MKVFIGADHNGFRLKKELIKKMKDFVDVNPVFKTGDDYPLIAKKLCKNIKNDNKGILICGSGMGVCIAANKFKGVRAVVCNSQKEAELSRQDTDSNVICLSGWSLTTEKALKIIKKWLSSSFNALPRHVRRINQIKDFEKWK